MIKTSKRLIKKILNTLRRPHRAKPPSIVPESIFFDIFEKPLVSIIIPVYGHINFTLMCLKSIQVCATQIEFEIIIVDDHSPDDSASILSRVSGIQIISNNKNLGFIRSCNHGVNFAKGKYVCFLNNDTEVHIGWLDELIRTFNELPGTGLVGSKLIYPDGRLQEAGGIVWRDGTAANFGKFQNVLNPIYNYAREVDYCSGASIILPKALFDELDGFDEHYLPAYCEDVDLALKIREKGYRVIFQPLSCVTHYEGITSGTDTSSGTKAYQLVNTKKIFDRWGAFLKTYQQPGMDVDKAKDRRAIRRALVIDTCTPTPNQDAGSVITFNILLLLREMDFQVTFIPEDNFLFMPEYTTALQRAGIEVLYAPYVTSVKQHLKNKGDFYDLALLFRPQVAKAHLKNIRKICPKAKIIFSTVDLHFLRMAREAKLYKDGVKEKAAHKMEQIELAIIQEVDASLVHSTAEQELLSLKLPGKKVFYMPLIMSGVGTNIPFDSRKNIIFIGGFQHMPNVDAVKHFVADIMPLLRIKLPGIKFFVVGSKSPPEIHALACKDIIIKGFIENLKPLLDEVRVAVAPLRFGAGAKLKIVTAMAAGVPVVVTPLAGEGMQLSDGVNVLVADNNEFFASAVATVYEDEKLWNKISKTGISFAEETWGADAAWDRLALILNEVGISVHRKNYKLKLYTDPSRVTEVVN